MNLNLDLIRYNSFEVKSDSIKESDFYEFEYVFTSVNVHGL